MLRASYNKQSLRGRNQAGDDYEDDDDDAGKVCFVDKAVVGDSLPGTRLRERRRAATPVLGAVGAAVGGGSQVAFRAQDSHSRGRRQVKIHCSCVVGRVRVGGYAGAGG